MLSIDVIVCEADVPPSVEKGITPVLSSDFLLPIHVRQEDASSPNAIIPLLNQWKLVQSDDPFLADRFLNFFRVCPTIEDEQSPGADLQVMLGSKLIPDQSILFQFVKILSEQSQMDLLQQYTNDDLSAYAQSVTNWQVMFQCLQEYRRKAIDLSERRERTDSQKQTTFS